MRLKIACTVLVMLMLFALTGCLFGPEQKTSAPIDPPPAGVEEKYERQGAQKKAEEDAKADKKTRRGFSSISWRTTGMWFPTPWTCRRWRGSPKRR